MDGDSSPESQLITDLHAVPTKNNVVCFREQDRHCIGDVDSERGPFFGSNYNAPGIASHYPEPRTRINIYFND